MNTENVSNSHSCVGVSEHSHESMQAIAHANRILTPGFSNSLSIVADFPIGDEDDLDDDDDFEDDDLEDDDLDEDAFDEEEVDDLGYMEDIDEKEFEEPFYEEDFEEDLEEDVDLDDEL
ncbi:MAG: hypothetical protein V4714_16725 [Bacteroidota bacterium]